MKTYAILGGGRAEQSGIHVCDVGLRLHPAVAKVCLKGICHAGPARIKR